MHLHLCSKDRVPLNLSAKNIMATADQLKALIKGHIDQDDERFRTLAMQVAATEARQGHTKVAVEIRDLIDQAKLRQREVSRPVPIATPRGELAGLLAVSYPKTRLSDMVMDDDIQGRLKRILREQRGREKLLSHGLQPRRKLLLTGPPGSGKTMTASALAGELNLPLYVIVLDGLITKFMGETAAKLRLVFNALAENQGIYLFDEFDAIGGESSVRNDVGEIHRVLNSFLQFMEQDESSSLLIGATNHPQSLDRALFRRFDDVIEYQHPSNLLVRKVLENRLAMFDTSSLDWKVSAAAADGMSYADITQACESAAKEAILNDMDRIDTHTLVVALEERQGR